MYDKEKGESLIEDEKCENKDISGIPLLSKPSAELPSLITVNET
jgi:hypothetical protein